VLLLPTHIAQLPADQTLRSFQFAWRNILIDNELSEEEDIFEVGNHSDVSTLIEALKKRHPQHPNITGIEAALRAVSQHSDGEFDTEGSRSFVLCLNLGVVGPPSNKRYGGRLKCVSL